jgi:sugar lactone lactonase YvrE
MKLLRASVLLITLPLIAQQPNSAIDQLQTIRTKVHASHTANDWRANLAGAEEQKALLNHAPASLLEAARADVHLADFAAALTELREFVRMGQASDLPEQSPDFAPLRSQPQFAGIERDMAANRAPISLASTAFQLTDDHLLTEDIDYDPAGHRFLVTSIREHKIVALDASGAASDFAQAPNPWPMMAIKVDRARHRVWATEFAIHGLIFSPASDQGRSAVLCYDLQTGKLLRRVEGPSGAGFGDMLLLPNGDVLVSDGDQGGVYRLPANGAALERLDHGEFISPQTPALAPGGRRIFVPDYLRGIAVLDLATRHVRWLAPQGRYALNGIDGLYCDRGRLIAVQNGTTPERVVVFTLNAQRSGIVSEKIIERATPTLGDPTHGVVLGNDFWYIANSGWDVIDDHGNLNPGARLTPARIMRAKIR